MAETTKTLKEQLAPVQDALAVAGFQLRTARNKAEGAGLSAPNADLLDEVNALGAVIKRVDAISAHLRKIGEAK